MLTPEQEWTLVACGMIAHADDMLEFGEWDQILRLVDASVDDEQMQPWLPPSSMTRCLPSVRSNAT